MFDSEKYIYKIEKVCKIKITNYKISVRKYVSEKTIVENKLTIFRNALNQPLISFKYFNNGLHTKVMTITKFSNGAYDLIFADYIKHLFEKASKENISMIVEKGDSSDEISY
ncbi:MAG: hypothetical protein RBS24_00060 [Bacilli bacterium]|nr:hypothetical protein [Bacilli bacterium]